MIVESHTTISNHSGSIPQIDIDYLTQNSRQLYEAVLMLNHTNALHSLDEVKAAVTQKILAEKRAAELRMPEPTPVVEVKVPEPVAVEVHEPTAAPAFQQERVVEPKRYSPAESLHQKIAPQRGSTVSDKMNHKPIRDIKSAIGINEKFQFITKLFSGNLQHYSEAIDKINTENNLSSAQQFIDGELIPKHHWNKNDEHVKHFMELVERRFS